MARIALVAGGTGLVGAHLMDLLTGIRKYDQVKMLVRKESAQRYPGVSVIKVDFERLSDFSDHLHADMVFCCLGTTMRKAGSKDQFYKVDLTYPLALAKLSKDLGCRQFNMITASGANPNSMFFYNRVKGEVEQELRTMNFRNLNIFRPSLLIGERDERRIGERIGISVAKTISPLLIGGMKKFRAIHAKTVAMAMLRVSLAGFEGTRVFESDVIEKHGNFE